MSVANNVLGGGNCAECWVLECCSSKQVRESIANGISCGWCVLGGRFLIDSAVEGEVF